MKVAVITLQMHTNYGGVLQAFALQRVLESLGHDVEIIQLDEILPEPEGVNAVRKFLTRSFRKYVLRRRDVELFRERRINREFPSVGAEFLEFFRKYLNIRYISSFSEISASDYDAFVVGSDQVWRPKYNPALMHSFLDFTWEDKGRKSHHGLPSDGKRPVGWDVDRIAYAVSFGCEGWEYSDRQTALASELAGRFDALSFRELSGVRNASEHLGTDSVTVLDPTMLLDADDYLGLIWRHKGQHKDFSRPLEMTEGEQFAVTADEKPVVTEGERTETERGTGVFEREAGVFEYVLDWTAETEALVAELEADLARPVHRFLPANPRGREEISLRVQPSVESWIAGIAGAGFVLTDSFHACVFSILFHRPFAVVGNRGRGLSRITWLLEQFGLENRLVGNASSFPECDIDWNAVDARLERLRAESLEFLKKNLK